MDFEWDTAKEQANRKKHGIDFRTATKVFLDPHVIEYFDAKKGSTTSFRLNPKKPPKPDWRSFNAISEEQRHRAALSDPDTPPATEAQLARARRIPTIGALRTKLNLTQEEFAARFHLPLGTVRDWEQGAHCPDKAAQVLLKVIANDPDAVVRALES